MSDVEAYCRQRTKVLGAIRQLLIESTDLRMAPEDIDPDTVLFGTGLGLDSVDAVEIVIALEMEMGVKLGDDRNRRRALRSVNAMVDAVLAARGEWFPARPAGKPEVATATATETATATATMTGGTPVAEARPGDDAEALAFRALREGVVWCDLPDVHTLRLGGEGAFACLDRMSTAPLYVREGEMRNSLFLADDGGVFADVTLAREGGGYTLFVEGPTRDELAAYLARAAAGGSGTPEAAATSIEWLEASHALVCVTGPFAWELMSTLVGPAVIGMPYLSVMESRGVTCYRAGKTGEYGYDVLVPRDALPAWRAQLEDVGRNFDLQRANASVLEVAALENWHFNIRAVRARAARAASPLTPLELQLQWRVGSQRAFVGAAALRARKATPEGYLRATAFVADVAGFSPGAAIHAGDRVVWNGAPSGEVLDAAWSPTREAWVGLALLPADRAHPWLTGFAAVAPAREPVPFRTVTPPLLDNRSLYVDPHRGSYAARGTLAFPPLVSS